MSWTACYNNVCQTYQSDKEDFRWYLKSSRKNLHETQVKRHVDSLYSKSDSEKSYEVIKLSSTEKELLWDKLDYMQWETTTLVIVVKKTFYKKSYKKSETWLKQLITKWLSRCLN